MLLLNKLPLQRIGVLRMVEVEMEVPTGLVKGAAPTGPEEEEEAILPGVLTVVVMTGPPPPPLLPPTPKNLPSPSGLIAVPGIVKKMNQTTR